MQSSKSQIRKEQFQTSISFSLEIGMCLIITVAGTCFVSGIPMGFLVPLIEGMILSPIGQENVSNTDNSNIALIHVIGGLLLPYGATNLVYAITEYQKNKMMNVAEKGSNHLQKKTHSNCYGSFRFFSPHKFFAYQIAWGLALFCLGISFSFIHKSKTVNNDDTNRISTLILIGFVWTLTAITGKYYEDALPKNYSIHDKGGEEAFLLSHLNETNEKGNNDKSEFYDPQFKSKGKAHLATTQALKEEEVSMMCSKVDLEQQEKLEDSYDHEHQSLSSDVNRVKGPIRLLQLAYPQSFYLITGCLALLIRLPFSLAIPHLISVTLGALSRSDFIASRKAILQLVLCALIDGVFDFVCVFLYGYANLNIVKDVRLKTFKTLLKQEMAFFDTHTSGSLASRLTSDCGQMGSDLTWFFRFSVESVVRIAGIIIYMLIRCPSLGLCTMSIVPLVAFLNRMYGVWLQQNAKSVQDSLAKANSIAQDALSCIRTVIAFASEDLEYHKYYDQIGDNFRLETYQLIAQGLYYMIVSNILMNAVVVSSLLFIGMILIQRGQLTAEILLAFMLYQGSLQGEIQNFFNAFTALIRSSGAGDKVFELLDRTIPEPGTGNFSLMKNKCVTRVQSERVVMNNKDSKNEDGETKTKKSVVIQNVSFAYPGRINHIILNDLNLEILPGTTMALVGVSGCGKSTIMGLLQRFYDPTFGQILMDGISLKDLDLQSHRQSIGVVTQDPVLFSGSILSNITYGCQNSDATMEDVIRATKQANAHDFIQSFPDKYETQVGERGVQLSGGQKQRIAIARALVKKPSLLLLDEATSALDSDAEKSVQEALDHLLSMNEHMTTIIIAHRLQTIRNADCIAVIDQGRVVEIGTHDQLLQESSHNKIYRKMVQQSSLHNGTISSPTS